jgi:DNA primase
MSLQDDSTSRRKGIIFARMIPRETVNLILESARIEEVVGDFVTLKRSGSNLSGRCPFHDEKTPSFVVSPAKGIFKCFGCGKAGDSVKFIMEHEHFTYPEALKYLARRYNITVEEKEATPEQAAADSERESLFLVNQFALQYFVDIMMNDENGQAIGLSYFKERGFTTQTIEKFQLGYALEGRDNFTQLALEKGYKKEYLLKLGLTKQNERGELYDYFRGRVMFPIFNVAGRVIGFGGRVLAKNEKTAKYLNSPESEIYVKSKTLYGINHAKSEIINKDLCYLVEGYTDVISLHQAGITNVVASSGTSLTEEQIKLIKRYTQNVTILYDGDYAGIKASFRGIDMFLEQGLNVKILLFPDGEDPDSFARKTDPEELKNYLSSNSTDFITFKTGLLMKEAENDPIKKAGVIKDIVRSIALIPDLITRNTFIQACSVKIGMDEQALVTELNRYRRTLFKEKNNLPEELGDLVPEPHAEKELKEFVSPSRLVEEEKQLLRFLLQYGPVELIYLNNDEEQTQVFTSIADYIMQELENDAYQFVGLSHQPFYDDYCRVWNYLKKKSGIPHIGAIIHETQYESEGLVEDENNLESQENPYIDNPENILSYFLRHENQEFQNLVINLTFDNYQLSPNWYDKAKIYTTSEKDNLYLSMVKILFSLKLAFVNQVISDNVEMLKKTDNEETQLGLLTEIRAWEKLKKQLSETNELGRVVIR